MALYGQKLFASFFQKRSAFFLLLLVAAGPYAKLAQMQTVFDGLPAGQRDKIILRQHVSHQDPADHGPIQMWVIDHGKRIDLPIAADGALTLGSHPDWVAEGLIVQTNQPEGKHVNLEVDLDIVPPPTPDIPAAYLLAAMDQAQAAIKQGARAAGGYLASLAAPSVNGTLLKLGRCCHETLQLTPPPSGSIPVQSSTGEFLLTRDFLEQNKSARLHTSAPILRITANAP